MFDASGWSPDDVDADGYDTVTFWGGPFDGQEGGVRRDGDHFSYPMWQYNTNHQPTTYMETYVRDGRFLRYRGRTG